MSKKKESPKSSKVARDSKTGKFTKVIDRENRKSGKDKPKTGGTDYTGPRKK